MATEKELKLVQLLRKLNSVQNIILSRIAETKNGDINYDDYDYVDNLCEDLLSTLNFESDPEVLQGLELETSHIEFTNSDLMRIFKSRLKTQDRISNTGCKMLYPINYIRALYNQEGKQDELRKILEEIIKDITFHVKESEESVEIKGIKFPEIKSLHIDPNEKIVRVYSDNKWYILWDPENRGKIEATAMREVSIDHENPMKKALDEMFDKQDSEIKKIGAFLNDNESFNNKAEYYAKIKQNLESNGPSDIDFQKLGEEIKILNRNLRMMHITQNLSDGNKKQSKTNKI